MGNLTAMMSKSQYKPWQLNDSSHAALWHLEQM